MQQIVSNLFKILAYRLYDYKDIRGKAYGSSEILIILRLQNTLLIVKRKSSLQTTNMGTENYKPNFFQI